MQPGQPGRPTQAPGQLALIAEATKRAGLVWITAPGQQRPHPAWHIWHARPGDAPTAGAAYVLTGPGEQPLPGLADGIEVTVTVPSKDSGGTLVTWTAAVTRVVPGAPEWHEVIGPLLAGRLNASHPPTEASPAERWAHTGAVFRLTPAHTQ